MRTRSMMTVVILAVTVLVAGCGGDDDAADDGAGAAATDDGAGAIVEGSEPDVEPPVEGDVESPVEGEASSTGAPGTGTMTIGDLSYDLEVTRCVTIAGAIAADAVAVDEPDNVSVSISLSPEDWRDRPASEGWTANGSLRLDVDEPYQQWEAGVEALEGYNLPGPSTLEDFAIASYDVSDDGRSASGEASFASIDALLRGDPLEPTPGSFAITCPDS